MNSAMTKIPRLSKSRFQYGLQCHKRLWLECHCPELADPLSESKQGSFNVGHQVGSLPARVSRGHIGGRGPPAPAKRPFERRGVFCGKESTACTNLLFSFGGVLVRADVLLQVSELGSLSR